MRSSSSSSSSLLIAALLCCGPAFADMPPPGSTTIWSEPVKGSEIPFAVVEAVIDAPPERVWQIVSRCNDYVKHMPRIAASKELKREGDGDAFTTTCQVTADLPFPLGDLTSVSKAVHGVERGPDGAGVKFTRRWTFLSGDYDLNEGSWTLLAVDDGKKTKATYRIRVRPKLALPDSMLASFTAGALPDVIKKLREGTARKP